MIRLYSSINFWSEDYSDDFLIYTTRKWEYIQVVLLNLLRVDLTNTVQTLILYKHTSFPFKPIKRSH